ncbi:MAG: DUF5667 domain-containing protein [Candidatus Limnocylindria bacterium]
MSAVQRCIAVIDPVGTVIDAVTGAGTGAVVLTVPDPARLLAAPQEIGNAVDLVVIASYGPLDWKAVRSARDRWNTIVVANRYDRNEAVQALSRGVIGYIDGSQPPVALRRSMRRALAGHLGFEREALSAWLRDNGESAGAYAVLTPRQREVMTLVGRGWSDDQIARSLAVDPATVRGHLRRATLQLQARGDRVPQVAEFGSQPMQRAAARTVPLAARWAAGLILIGSLSAAAAGPASAGSLPSELLYPVKLAGEAVQTALAFAPQDRTAVELSIASNRLDEARVLMQRGSAQLAIETVGQYIEHLATAAAIAVNAERDHVPSTPAVARLTEQLVQKQVEAREIATALAGYPATSGAAGVLAAVTTPVPPQPGASIALRLAETATTTANQLAEGTEASAPEVSKRARRAESVAHAAAVTVASGSASTSGGGLPAASGAAGPAQPGGRGGANDGPQEPASTAAPRRTSEPARSAEPTSAVAPSPTAKASPTPTSSPSALPAAASSAPPSETPTPSPTAVPGQSPAPSATPLPPIATPAPAGTTDSATIPPTTPTPLPKKAP